MIEMQYNFPLLPGQPSEWRNRLRAAVDTLGDDGYDELRPTFRSDMSVLTNIGADWMGMPRERTYLVEGNHQGSLIAMMASGLATKPVAVDAAAYTGALEQARALACPLVGCAVDGEGMVPASLREQCAKARKLGKPVAAVYMIPTVHNPLGSVASLGRREELVAVAREFNLIILEDEAYSYMDPDAAVSVGKLAPERTFTIRGLSKSYAPGVRTGFVVAPEQFAAGMWTAIKNCATGANLIHARAAVTLIADGLLDRVIAMKIKEGRRRNMAARALIGAHCWPGAEAAWHLWVNLPPGTSSQAFEQRLAERGVLISGGNWFAADVNSAITPNGVRIALGGEVEAGRCQMGVEAVSEELTKVWG